MGEPILVIQMLGGSRLVHRGTAIGIPAPDCMPAASRIRIRLEEDPYRTLIRLYDATDNLQAGDRPAAATPLEEVIRWALTVEVA